MSFNQQSSQQEHQIDPALSFELKYHNELHHVSRSQIHDASKPVLQTSTDAVLKQEQSSTLADIKTSAVDVAANISHKAAQLTHAAQDKIAALGHDVFPTSSASTRLASAAPTDKLMHTLPADVRHEVLHHAPLTHVSQSEIVDQSAPVLLTATDSMLAANEASTASKLTASLSSSATSVAEKLEHVGASITTSADRFYDKVMNAMTPKSAQSASLSSSSMPQVIHTLPTEVREEVLSHPSLHHVSASEIDDQSAPVLSTPTDSLLAKNEASTASKISMSLSSVAASISHKASDLYNSITHSSAAATPAPEQRHELPAEVKQEVLYHAPLTHVSHSEIHDASKPVLHTSTDAELAAREAPITTKISASLSSAATTVAAAMPSKEQVSASLSKAATTMSTGAHIAAQQLPSTQQVKSTLATAAASISTGAHVVAEKLAPTPVTHTLPADVKEEVLHHAPLHHVSQIHDQSAPVLSTPTDNVLQPQRAALIDHTLPFAVKQEVLHHAPLHHVSSSQIVDQSAPVLAAPMDSMWSKTTPTTTEKISASLSSAATTVAAALPSKEVVSASLSKTAAVMSSSMSSGAHIAADAMPSKEQVKATLASTADTLSTGAYVVAEKLPSSAQVKSSLSSAATTMSEGAHVVAEKLPSAQQISASLSSAAHVVTDKLAAVGASISHAYHDATTKQTKTVSVEHMLAPEIASQIKQHPQLKHVATSDHSAPVLTTDTDSSIPKIAHHNIGIPTPQHPHVTLHPGKVDLSYVQSLIPADHSHNLLASQKFNDTAYEVSEGGLAWSVPLESNNTQSLTVTYNNTQLQDATYQQQQQDLSSYTQQQPAFAYTQQPAQSFVASKLEQQQPTIYSSTTITTATTTTPSA